MGRKARPQEQQAKTPAAQAAATASNTGGGGGEAGSVPATPSQPEDLSPPYILMEHLPLAVLTNAVRRAGSPPSCHRPQNDGLPHHAP